MAKILRWITRLMPVWVVLAGIVGYLHPPMLTIFEPIKDWLFAFTMLGIGIVLKSEDFLPILKAPHWVVMGTLAQFVIMPLLGFLIAKGLQLPPDLAIGVIMVGAVPGAMASNVISYIAEADVAYSVALTTTSTLLSPVLTPLSTYILGSVYVSVPFLPMLLSIIKMVILPLLIGFTLRYLLKERVEAIVDIFPALSALCIAFICGLVVALNADSLKQVSLIIFVAVFLHNLFGLILGYAAGILFRFDVKRRRTLAFEVGMQNAGLGAVLSLKHFSAQSALPNALFATWCIITASLLAGYWKWRKNNIKSEPDSAGMEEKV